MSTRPVRDAFTIRILHHIIKNEQKKVTPRKNRVRTCQSGQDEAGERGTVDPLDLVQSLKRPVSLADTRAESMSPMVSNGPRREAYADKHTSSNFSGRPFKVPLEAAAQRATTQAPARRSR
jgi:hypothetical protein